MCQYRFFSVAGDSISGVQASRGQKRPNMASAFSKATPKSRGSIAEQSQKSLVSGAALQAPLCRPWDRGDLQKRLATFKSMTWFAKPQVHSSAFLHFTFYARRRLIMNILVFLVHVIIC